MMSVWTAASTFAVLSSPAGPVGDTVAAVGKKSLLTPDEFAQLWRAFFPDGKYDSPLCGSVRENKLSETHLVAQDQFLVYLRGFRSSVCRPEAWFVSSMRIDPCRLRLESENKTRADIHKCSREGKFSEIRFVLQPIEKTDRGPVFPDVALHLSYSLADLKDAARIWRAGKTEEIISYVKTKGEPNDVSLFLGGAGLERWTFARVIFFGKKWMRDRLPHGGYYESLSDAELGGGVVRTLRASNEPQLSDSELLKPLSIHPLQGSCVSCHLAGRGRSSRIFRQLGWGLAGEPLVSERVRAEAVFAAKELQLLTD